MVPSPTVRAIWEGARRVQSAGEDGASTLGWGTAIALSPSGERMAKLAPSGASDAWRGEIPLSTPANQQAAKPPSLSPDGARATSPNVRSRSGAAFGPPLWRPETSVGG